MKNHIANLVAGVHSFSSMPAKSAHQSGRRRTNAKNRAKEKQTRALKKNKRAMLFILSLNSVTHEVSFLLLYEAFKGRVHEELIPAHVDSMTVSHLVCFDIQSFLTLSHRVPSGDWSSYLAAIGLQDKEHQNEYGFHFYLHKGAQLLHSVEQVSLEEYKLC